MPSVQIFRDGDVAIVTIDNPPVNALSVALRSELHAAVHSVENDVSIKGAILTGADGNFVAGADIRELKLAQTEPTLPQVTTAIEASRIPWVAAINGAALGGGLEVAMACHGRVATDDSKLGLPEVTLGMIAGAGGTVRLPRLVPMRQAVAMATTGKPITAAEALAAGLVDQVTTENLVVTAKDCLAQLLSAGSFQRVMDRSVREPLTEEQFDELRAAIRGKARGQDSPVEALEAIRDSARLPASEALARSRARFLRLVASEQAEALRYVFFAERAAGASLRRIAAKTTSLSRVGVIGGGTMGAGITAALLIAGSSVTLIERDEASAEVARGRVEAVLAESAKRGTAINPTSALARLKSGTSYAELADHTIIIEAVFEDMAVKASVFRKLDAVVSAEAVLATNTSYLDVNELAEATRHPERILGLHFFSPAHVMKLLEVVRGRRTGDVALAIGAALAHHLHKIPVVAGVCDGFIGNRIMSTYRRECDFMLEEGATPQDVDAAMREFGFAMGIYQVQDLAGLDIAWAMRKRRAQSRPLQERYSRIADLLCEAGRLGRKTRRGWYDYSDGEPRADAEVTALIRSESARLGFVRRTFTADEIMGRILSVMKTEAAKLLDEGIAESAGDIDIAMIFGFGFPRHRGGPMFLTGRQS